MDPDSLEKNYGSTSLKTLGQPMDREKRSVLEDTSQMANSTRARVY